MFELCSYCGKSLGDVTVNTQEKNLVGEYMKYHFRCYSEQKEYERQQKEEEEKKRKTEEFEEFKKEIKELGYKYNAKIRIEECRVGLNAGAFLYLPELVKVEFRGNAR